MMLPDMMFADGEEPVGVRVLTYQSSCAINSIQNALDEEEIQFIRESSFGKLVNIGEKPGFSGRFARFFLSTQLKVEKNHEAWFRFAGKPIRFSLRDFPKKQKLKKKKKINDKPYWPELFGSVEEMRVSMAIKMLRKKTVTDKDIRMKLACLALSDSDEYDVDRGTRKTKKKTLSPAHAREVDKKEAVLVRSIIPQDPARPVDEYVLVWSDEVVDIKVSFMLTCTNDNHVFTKDLFRGGVTKADVERMREKAKTAGKKKGLPKKDKDPPVCMEDESRITSIVNAILRPELNRIDGDIADVVSSLKEVSAESLGYEKKSFKTEMMKSTPAVNTQSPVQPPKSTEAFEGPADEVVPRKTTPIARDGNDEIIDNVMENLSHYSMPPAAENKCLGPAGKSCFQQSVNPFDGTAEENNTGNEMLDTQPFEAESPHPHQSNMPSNGKVGESREDHSSRSAHSQTHEHLNPILPSFSLGLTQELGGHHDDDDDEMGENEDQLGAKHNGAVKARPSDRPTSVAHPLSM
ncbi:hypothetical protein Bca4012_005959 [Brassica carinata]|uniref:DUF1985 domain-containing protein n=1 Tax=Brassica carinata TaxID=52824 RepID=A0A8X7RQ26_BRACI|nr:hypothetical protein Bca52824_039773 [Brassica carinata]